MERDADTGERGSPEVQYEVLRELRTIRFRLGVLVLFLVVLSIIGGPHRLVRDDRLGQLRALRAPSFDFAKFAETWGFTEATATLPLEDAGI